MRRTRSRLLGFGVKTAPNFRCYKGACIFALKDLVLVTSEAGAWDGYTFESPRGSLRPNCDRKDVVSIPPMMVNTACRELNERTNVRFRVYCNSNGNGNGNSNSNSVSYTVSFVATRAIGGNETLLVPYGGKYSKELRKAREAQREAERAQKEALVVARTNLNHDYLCPKCGLTCNKKNRIRHWRECNIKIKSNNNDTKN